MTTRLEAHTHSFFEFLKYEKRYSRHTLTAYEGDLADFQSWFVQAYGDHGPAEITHSMLRSWLVHLHEQKLTPRTISRKLSSLRSFFTFLLRKGEVKVLPTAKLVTPKAGRRLPVFVKEAETADMVEGLAVATENWKSLNARMLVALFYNTGMRLSELIGLKEQQVDAGRGQIKVLGKGNKERSIPVSKETLAMIREYREMKKKEFGETDDVLLVTEKGRKMYPKYAYLLVKASLAAAGTLEKKSPHVLRHTFATHLMNNGADLNAVKELLGHSSLAATQVYTHNTIDKLRDIHRKAHPKG